MQNKIKIGVLAFLMTIFTFVIVEGKAKEGVILVVDGEEVPTQEFLYLFNKNNLQQSQPQTIEEYLQLFEIYRLKVAEAKRQGVDTTSSFRSEISQYRRELLEPYVTDTTYFNHLIDEALHRDSILVESSHIMIIRTHDEEKDKRNLEVLDSLRTEILNGNDFITLAKEYSQDKFSSEKGGYLGFSPAGTYPYGFETAVYETPEGEISEIVESHVGWHLVKSGARKMSSEFNRPVKPREVIKTELERKTSSPFDTRYHAIRKKTYENLQKRHPEINLNGMGEEEAFNVLMEAEEKSQYEKNSDYRNLVDEYTNGSLLYVVSVENIWDRAANDTQGLKNFYDENKEKYTWESPHAKGILVQAINDSVVKEIKNAIQGMSADSIPLFIKKTFKKEAVVDRFNVAQGTNAMIDNIMFGGETTTPKVKNFQSYFVLEGRLVETPENLEDVRSQVINDYQEKLEEDWIKYLRNTHKIEVNQKELNRIKKSLY